MTSDFYSDLFIMTHHIRTRFAPSPTGFLHVGGLRTALYSYLFAKKQGGDFVLRIEDTDQKRLVSGAIEGLLSVLETVGLRCDEGLTLREGICEQHGDHGPYIQSERLPLYQKYANELVSRGLAYHCFCTADRLTEMREIQIAAKRAPRYDRHCLTLSQEEVEARQNSGEASVIRFRIPDDRDIEFTDLIRGTVRFHTRDMDDQVIIKSDGFPTYHLAVVVDDHLMEITHVIRGEEWLPSTPKHILIYEAFGWQATEFGHLPLLLNPDKSKLSKRQGDVAVEDYLAKGYLKEALINFVALLGWNPGKGETQEIFTLTELVEKFDLEKVNKAGAVFDIKKLDWMNAEYIKRMDIDSLFVRLKTGNFLEKELIWQAPDFMQTDIFLKRVLTIEQDRLAKLSEFGEQNPFFFTESIEYEIGLLRWKENSLALTHEALEKARTILGALDEPTWGIHAELERVLLEAAGDKRGDFLWPLRVALSGAQRSPSPFDCAWVLGKDATLQRIDAAIRKCAISPDASS